MAEYKIGLLTTYSTKNTKKKLRVGLRSVQILFDNKRNI